MNCPYCKRQLTVIEACKITKWNNHLCKGCNKESNYEHIRMVIVTLSSLFLSEIFLDQLSFYNKIHFPFYVFTINTILFLGVFGHFFYRLKPVKPNT